MVFHRTGCVTLNKLFFLFSIYKWTSPHHRFFYLIESASSISFFYIFLALALCFIVSSTKDVWPNFNLEIRRDHRKISYERRIYESGDDLMKYLKNRHKIELMKERVDTIPSRFNSFQSNQSQLVSSFISFLLLIRLLSSSFTLHCFSF